MSTADGSPTTLAQELSGLISKITAKESDFFADERIENLHDLRVNLRKLRSWLKIIKIADYPVKKLQKHVTHCHAIGGELRNFDVLIHWIEKSTPPVSPKLIHALYNKRTQLKKAFLKNLIDEKPLRKLRILGRDFLIPIKGISKRDVEPHVKQYIAKNWEKFHHILQHYTDDLVQLHEMRKILKKVRYSLTLLPTVDEKCQHTLKELQDILGYINDRRVWIELLGSQFSKIEAVNTLENIFRKEMNEKIDAFRLYIDTPTMFLPCSFA